jgi:hypothetical protein
MRSTLLAAATTFVLLGSSALAQAPLPREEADEIARAFRDADLDGDGFLTRAEFARAWTAHPARAAAAERVRLERRIASARAAGSDDAPSASDAALAGRLLDALERLESRLLGAGSRAAFMELRGEAIGLARAYAAHPSAPVATRFLEALDAIEVRAKGARLTRADLDGLRGTLGAAGRRGEAARGGGEQPSGPAVGRRASAATGMGEGRPLPRAASAPAEARAGGRR